MIWNTRKRGEPWTIPARPRTAKEELESSIRKYLDYNSPENLQKIVNDLITENVIDA